MKLKLTNVTELDRATRKVAHPSQNIDYNFLIGDYFEAPYKIEEDRGMVLIYSDEDCEEDNYTIRTSTVGKIERINNSDSLDKLIVETRNTVYFFEIIEEDAQ